jgi:hypothetical protein
MAYRTILLKGDPTIVEFEADEAITPGHLCERTSTGVKKHATAGGNCELMFALEDENQGKAVADAYVTANQAKMGIFESGDEVAAWLKLGENVAIGDDLESAGDGTLQAADVDTPSYLSTEAVRFKAIEAVDAASANTRIAVVCV